MNAREEWELVSEGAPTGFRDRAGEWALRHARRLLDRVDQLEAKVEGRKRPVGRPFLVEGQKTVPFGFRVPEGLLEKFKATAAERNVNVSDALRRGMRLWIEKG